MRAPGYAAYRDLYRGAMGEEEFEAASPLAGARLRALTGRDEPPERWGGAWDMAFCALADRAGGADLSGRVASETVGDASVTYAASEAGRTDLDAASPWLAGTGLLCAAVPLGGTRV